MQMENRDTDDTAAPAPVHGKATIRLPLHGLTLLCFFLVSSTAALTYLLDRHPFHASARAAAP